MRVCRMTNASIIIATTKCQCAVCTGGSAMLSILRVTHLLPCGCVHYSYTTVEGLEIVNGTVEVLCSVLTVKYPTTVCAVGLIM